MYCYKKVNNSLYRLYNDGIVADDCSYFRPNDDGIFIDQNNEQHYLHQIKSVDLLNDDQNIIANIYLFPENDDDNNISLSLKVVDKLQYNKINNFISSHLCNNIK